MKTNRFIASWVLTFLLSGSAWASDPTVMGIALLAFLICVILLPLNILVVLNPFDFQFFRRSQVIFRALFSIHWIAIIGTFLSEGGTWPVFNVVVISAGLFCLVMNGMLRRFLVPALLLSVSAGFTLYRFFDQPHEMTEREQLGKITVETIYQCMNRSTARCHRLRTVVLTPEKTYEVNLMIEKSPDQSIIYFTTANETVFFHQKTGKKLWSEKLLVSEVWCGNSVFFERTEGTTMEVHELSFTAEKAVPKSILQRSDWNGFRRDYDCSDDGKLLLAVTEHLTPDAKSPPFRNHTILYKFTPRPEILQERKVQFTGRNGTATWATIHGDRWCLSDNVCEDLQ